MNDPASPSPPPSDLTAIVLAAGRSRRMGEANKLLLPFRGAPIVRRAVRVATAAPVRNVVVVTGHERARVEEVLAGAKARLIHNPDYPSGMASSLRTGVAAAPDDASGFMILLGDMPLIGVDTLALLARRFGNLPPRAILIATTEEQRGHPVVFDAAYRDDLLRLDGDVGARAIIEANRAHVIEVDVDDPGILRDVDTHAAYRALRTEA